MRKPVMAGNWKMYKTAAETSLFFEKFVPLVAGATHAEVVICPPFVNIPAAVEGAKSTAIGIGAQDVFWLKEGAYTGEVAETIASICPARSPARNIAQRPCNSRRIRDPFFCPPR